MKKRFTKKQLLFIIAGILIVFSVVLANKFTMYNKVKHSVPKTSTKATQGSDDIIKDDTKTDFKVHTPKSGDSSGYSEQVVQDELAGEYDNQVDDSEDELPATDVVD
jgi:uncharacterized protein YpmB